MAALFIAHKVSANYLQTIPHNIFPVAHIRYSLAMHFMQHSQRMTKHEQFTKNNEVNVQTAKLQVSYNPVNFLHLQNFLKL